MPDDRPRLTPEQEAQTRERDDTEMGREFKREFNDEPQFVRWPHDSPAERERIRERNKRWWADWHQRLDEAEREYKEEHDAQTN